MRKSSRFSRSRDQKNLTININYLKRAKRISVQEEHLENKKNDFCALFIQDIKKESLF